MKTKEADSGLKVCPADQELSQLLDGDCPDTTDLAQHVETCVACQAKLNQLTDADDVRLPKSQVPRYLSSFASHLARATDSALDAAPNVTLPGFEIQECVGRGGMGAVYRARHEQLDREVAVKVIAAGTHAGPEYRERLDREGKLVAKLDHPNIVRIFDSGQHDDLPYLVLEFMDGGSLADRRQKISDPKTIARLIEILARALHAAHDVGIIHRDLKPGNVLLAQADAGAETIEIGGQHFIPRIADFGLSKQVLQQEDVSQSTGMLGTPGYMAPEQANEARSEIGAATDIHALGIILYELLAGSRPFDARTTLATVENVRSKPPAPLQNYRSDVPPPLEDIFRQCLHKQPSARYTSALELAEELARFQAGQPLQHTQRSNGGRGSRNALRFLAAAAAAVLLFTIIRVQTNRGTIVIDADDSMEIEIRRNDRSVDTFQVSNTKERRSVYSGDIEIVIPSSAAERYTVSNSRFQMTRNGHEVVTIRKITDSIASVPKANARSAAPALGASERKIVTWFVANGGHVRIPSRRLGIGDVDDIPDGELNADYLLDENGFLRGEHLPLIASLPNLQNLQIFYAENLGDNLAALNSMNDLQTLSLANCTVDDKQWAAFDNYQNLLWLSLEGTQVSSSFVPKLKRCERLQQLDLDEQQILHPQGLQFLKSVSSLDTLGLYDFTDSAAAAIADLPHLTSIRLHDGRGMSHTTIDAICKCRNLRRLKFWRTDLTGIDLRQLGTLERLVWVELMNVNLFPDDFRKIETFIPNADLMQCVERDIESMVTEAGGTLEMRRIGFKKTKHPTNYALLEIDAVTFVNTPLLRDDHFEVYQHLKHLKSLTVNQAGINGSTLNHISHLTSLQHLSLAETQVNDRHIGFLPKLTGLKSLNLQGTEVTAQGLANLATLRKLDTVSLDGLQVTVDIVAALDQLPELKHLNLREASNTTIEKIASLKQLESISIDESYTITEKCLPALATLQNMTTLTLGTTNIEPESLEQLPTLLPNCTVVRKPTP